MEDEDLSYYNQPSRKTQGSSIQRKHEAMLERLSNLHQSRTQQSISRKSDSNSPPSFESTNSFLNRFADSKRFIESELGRCRNSADPELKSHLKSDLDKISTSIAELEKLVAENSYYLPSYDVRSSLKVVADLKETLENLSSELLPKKKFTFKNKGVKTDLDNVVKEPNLGNNDSVVLEKTSFKVRDSPGFRNMDRATLVKDFTGLEVGDFILSDLSSCEVRLIGCLRVLFIHRLQNCRVFVGPVLGSIHIEEVEGCLFMLSSHQIRIHHARKTDFYLRVRSRPIIEDCSGVRFAPYSLSYDGIEKDLKDSNLDEETGNWANVDDFKWLRAVHSPNWSILPESERIKTMCITNVVD